MEKKERFLGLLGHMFAQKLLALFQKLHVDFFQVKIGRLPA